MFLGPDSNDFAKHLPDAASKTLLRAGQTPDASTIFRVSTFGGQIVRGGSVATFDDGPIILLNEQGGGGDKVEVAVEHEVMAGETEEIELSAHFYNDGLEQPPSVIPRVTFTFEAGGKHMASCGCDCIGPHSAPIPIICTACASNNRRQTNR